VLIRVLGSAAGGGFPQWNCGCANCRGVREGKIPAVARTQESVAVSDDGEQWFLLNASPEIRAHIESFPPLHPREPRHSGIQAILLGNGDLDHCLGLLSLRESHPLVVYATDAVRRGFTEGNALYRTLERFPGQVTWRVLAPGRVEPLRGTSDRDGGLEVQAMPVPGKPPVHLDGRVPRQAEDNVAFRIRGRRSGRVLVYASAVGAVTDAVRRALAGADCVFFDGTFWTADELPALGLGDKRAEDMAHVPVGGPGGSLSALADLTAGRKIFIHLNNSNPMLRDDSPARAAVEAAGWEVAYDGMEVSL